MVEKFGTSGEERISEGEVFEELVKREAVANEVYGWLMEQKRTENIWDTSRPSLQEMSTEVLRALQSGEIFFIVQNPEKIEELGRARLLEVRTNKGIVFAAALAIRGDVDKEILIEQGDGLIKEMYEIHKSKIRENITKAANNLIITRRVTTADNIIINLPGIGEFPNTF